MNTHYRGNEGITVMRQALFSTLLCISILFSAGLQAKAITPELAEAQKTFEELSQSENPYIARMAEENLAKLQENQVKAPSPKRVEVPLLTRNNSSIAVPAILDGHVMGTFLVDTGATYTVITPRLARKLGIDTRKSHRKVRITTANGTVRAPLVTVPTISVGGLQVSNVEVIVQPLGNDILLAGLLGMNFFKDLEITFKKDKLILSQSESLETANR